LYFYNEIIHDIYNISIHDLIVNIKFIYKGENKVSCETYEMSPSKDFL